MTLVLRSVKGSKLTIAEGDGNLTHLQDQINTAAIAYPPVALSANTTLTRSSHYNRQIIVTTAGSVTLTATGTDALAGDFISVDVVGGGSVTLDGVTSQAGYTLTASSGGTVEAKSLVSASLVAATQAVSATGGDLTVALTDGSFTSNNLNLTSAHTNCVLDLSAVTIPTTLTWQTDAAGGYNTSSCKLRVLAGPVAPVAIVAGSGATVIGKAQVIEQSQFAEAHRTAANTLAVLGVAKSGIASDAGLMQFGFSFPSSVGGTSVTSSGVVGLTVIDACTAAAAATVTDGGAEYGVLRRVRYNAAAAAVNRAAGFQQVLSYRLEAANSSFPLVIRAAIADSITVATTLFGICSNASVGTGLNNVEPSAASTLDILGIGADSTDTNMQIMHRNGASSVAATKVDLGASFPRSQFVGYELRLYKNNAGTAFMAVVKNINSQAVTVKIINTNVPRNDRGYHSLLLRSSFTTAATASMDFIGLMAGI